MGEVIFVKLYLKQTDHHHRAQLITSKYL